MSSGRIRCTLDEIGEATIRHTLDRAIAAALPNAGGRIRELLEQLAGELARVDHFRARKQIEGGRLAPHRFEPGTLRGPAGPIVTDWCGHGALPAAATGDDARFCGRRAGDPVHVDQAPTDE